jgi:hypothetical protein
MGNYDFEQIAYFARKRFVEGCDTVDLLSQARSDTEKEEIALVCLLDVEDAQIRDIGLSCRYADRCKVTDCRARLKQMIQADLIGHN